MSDSLAGPNAHLLAGDIAGAPPARTPAASALGVSVLAHLIPMLLAILLVGRLGPVTPIANVAADRSSPITWIADVGGQGDGGRNSVSPSLERQRSAADEPRTHASVPEPAAISQPASPLFEVPAVTTIPDLQAVFGMTSPFTSAAPSGTPAGPGGGGPGTGSGPGSGPGPGAGSGDDPYHVGSGASSPLLLREVKPGYTGDAMRARIQGTVIVRAVVLPDGSVGAARVVRSLDTAFGLDEEAVKAVKLWRFRPGTLAGRPVPVSVDIELTFTLR